MSETLNVMAVIGSLHEKSVTFKKPFNCQHMERMFDDMGKHPKDSRNNREMDCESREAQHQ